MRDTKSIKSLVILVAMILWGCALPSCSLLPTGQSMPRKNSIEQSHILYRDAINLMDSGEYAIAQIKLEQIVADGSSSPSVYNDLGVCAMQSRDFELARWSFEQAIDLGSDAFEPRYNLGMLYESSGKLILARDLYQEAYLQSDMNILILGNLTRVQFKLGNHEDNVLEQLAEIQAKHPSKVWVDWARDAQVQYISSMRSGQNLFDKIDD